jgi:cation transport protein ChaC
VVAGSVGRSGRNEEYLAATVVHLKALGIRDHWLESVAERIAST